MPLHLLTNFEIQKYYQNEPKFNGVYSRNNLSKIKDGVYIINLDDYESIETHWIALYVNAKNVTYCDSFEVENIPKEIRKFVRNKDIITNIYRVQAYDSIMCGYFCIEFINFMLTGNHILSYIFSKKLSLSIVYSKPGHEYEKIFKEEESIEILKILGLINSVEEYQKIYNHV